jgi:ribose transport system permease protein
MPQPTTNTPAPRKSAGERFRAGNFGFLLNFTLLGLLILLWIALSLTTKVFLTDENIKNLMRQASLWAILAVGQTFVIIEAGIDLSMGAVVGLTSVVIAMLLTSNVPIWLAIIITLLFGVGIGAVNAFGITKLGLPPFIMTLAGLTSLRGVALLLTNGGPIAGLPTSFTSFSRAELFGLPMLFWVVVLVSIPAYVLLHHSRWGRYIFATGSNPEAARLSGVNVTRTMYLAYIISSASAALVGILVTSRLSIGIATTGDTWELQAIAGSVIGGASLFGAVGSVVGPLLGATLLSTINQGANLLNINAFWQRIVTGVLIVVIVFLDQLRRRKRT